MTTYYNELLHIDRYTHKFKYLDKVSSKRSYTEIHRPDNIPEECSVCLEKMKYCVETKCKHHFCKDCIIVILKKINNKDINCPYCRGEFELTNYYKLKKPKTKEEIEFEKIKQDLYDKHIEAMNTYMNKYKKKQELLTLFEFKKTSKNDYNNAKERLKQKLSKMKQSRTQKTKKK